MRIRIAIRCTARGGRIAVAMAISRDFPRNSHASLFLHRSWVKNGSYDSVLFSVVPSRFSGHVATAVPPPRLPKRAIITNEKLLKLKKNQ